MYVYVLYNFERSIDKLKCLFQRWSETRTETLKLIFEDQNLNSIFVFNNLDSMYVWKILAL